MKTVSRLLGAYGHATASTTNKGRSDAETLDPQVAAGPAARRPTQWRRLRGHERSNRTASAALRGCVGDEIRVSLLRSRLWSAGASPRRRARVDRRRSGIADLGRSSLPERRSELRTRHSSESPDSCEVPPAAL